MAAGSTGTMSLHLMQSWQHLALQTWLWAGGRMTGCIAGSIDQRGFEMDQGAADGTLHTAEGMWKEGASLYTQFLPLFSLRGWCG
jgi:hypothetical protein